MLSTVCVLNPILWFISLYNCPATVSHAERQNYQKKFCFLCVACLFPRIKSVWNFFSSRVRAKIFCVSPERSQAWAGHAPKISRALNDEVVFHISVPHSRSQNVSVAWTAVAAKKYVGEPSCPVPDKSLGIKETASGNKNPVWQESTKICFSLPACPGVQPSLRCEERQKAFLPFRESPQVAMEQRTGKPPVHSSEKKLSEPTATPHSSFLSLLLWRDFKNSFPGLWAVFCQRKALGACPDSKQPPHGFWTLESERSGKGKHVARTPFFRKGTKVIMRQA